MEEQPWREFLAEADERIEVLFADIEALRRVHAAADGRARRELVARIFRHVHTLKGSAASFPRLAPFSRLAHEFENLLDAVRSGRALLTGEAVDACEDATHALSRLLESVTQQQQGSTAAPEAPPAVLKQLRQYQSVSAPPGHVAEETNQTARPASVAALPTNIAGALSTVERRHLSESVREGARVVLLAAVFDLATLNEHFTRFTGVLCERGEIISTFPGDPATAPDGISFLILYATHEQFADLENTLAPFGAKLAWAGDGLEYAGVADAKKTTNEVASISNEVASPFAVEEAPQPDEANIAAGNSASSPIYVRVPLHELDELVTATHELYTDTLAVLEQTTFFEPHAAGETTAERARRRRLREDFSALEERVMSLRMQPLLPVLERAARAARINARAAGKEVELEVAGGEVRVDRALAERIGEPLLHLLRNAVDHGIEPPEERRAAGKTARGRVRLEVRAEGSRVLVSVADDGRGIDPERVGRVAVAHGLAEANTVLSQEHALRLIFRPGFSTAEKVSEVSGRGVGLDAVEHALEHAGGELRVRTERGAGTTFELRVPLALALVSVVVVRAGNYAYAFEASRVVEINYLKAADILVAAGETRGRAHWRGRQLPLVSLPALLGQAQAIDAREEIPVVVARRERSGAGESEHEPEELLIAVDEIKGEREALVRSLGRHATRWRGVGGAFAERDGAVALLLDLPRLLERTATAKE